MDNAALVAPTAEQAAGKKRRKKDKVRSAWISFAGRIVAQMVGAIATVALGVMVLHRYTANDARPPAGDLGYYSAPAAVGARAGEPPIHVIVLPPAMLGMREAGLGVAAADRSCAPQLDGAAASAAHLADRTPMPR